MKCAVEILLEIANDPKSDLEIRLAACTSLLSSDYGTVILVEPNQVEIERDEVSKAIVHSNLRAKKQ